MNTLKSIKSIKSIKLIKYLTHPYNGKIITTKPTPTIIKDILENYFPDSSDKTTINPKNK